MVAGVKWPNSSFFIGFTSATTARELTRFRGGHVVEADSVITTGGASVSVVHDAYQVFEVLLQGARYRGNVGTPSFSADSQSYQHLTAWWAYAAAGNEFEFARDTDKIHATVLDGAHSKDDTGISVDSAWSAGGASVLDEGDSVLIEDSGNPTVFEHGVVQENLNVYPAAGPHTITLHRGLHSDYADNSVVRHLEYLPKCKVLDPRSSPFTERDGGKGSHMWDFRFRFRTVR